MRIVGFIVRVLVLFGIFAGVGFWAAHIVVLRAVAQGQAEYNVRLASYMTGLFAGGSVAVLAGIVMLLLSRHAGGRGDK